MPGALINLLMSGASAGLFSDDAMRGSEVRPIISGLLQLVVGRGRGSDDGGGDSQGGAVPTAAQAAADMAAREMACIALQDLKHRRPSRIAAQPGTAASVVGGLQACLRQIAASSSPSIPYYLGAKSLKTLGELSRVVGAVALARGEHGGSTWAAFMLQLAPLRELITLIPGEEPVTVEVPVGIGIRVAFGLFSIAAAMHAVLQQQPQQPQQPQQQQQHSRLMSRQRYSRTAYRQP